MRHVHALSPEEQACFDHEGFLAVPRPIAEPPAIQAARDALERVFAAPDTVPAAQFRDLAGRPTGPAAIPELLDPIRFVPGLRSSPIVDACRAIAQEVIGGPVTLVFDHAIRKAPHNGEPTPWHQDAAYDPKRNDAWPNTVTVWVALQDVGVRDGCMCFVPGSHRGGVVAHEVRGSDTRGDLLRAVVAPDTPEVVCPLPAGGVTLHRRTTLHRTGPNEGDTARLAWILRFRLARRPSPTARVRAAAARTLRHS